MLESFHAPKVEPRSLSPKLFCQSTNAQLTRVLGGLCWGEDLFHLPYAAQSMMPQRYEAIIGVAQRSSEFSRDEHSVP